MTLPAADNIPTPLLADCLRSTQLHRNGRAQPTLSTVCNLCRAYGVMKVLSSRIRQTMRAHRGRLVTGVGVIPVSTLPHPSIAWDLDKLLRWRPLSYQLRPHKPASILADSQLILGRVD